MKAQDVMVRDVLTVKPETNVTDAIKVLSEHDISALPVVDADGDLVGILSEADLLPRAEDDEHRHPWWVEALMPASKLAEEFAKAHGKKVSEVMSTQVITASEDAPVSEIAALLERHRIKRLPIVADGKVVGIVSRSNLIQALASSKVAPEPKRESDRTIRLELLDRLGQQRWTDFGSRNVIVEDGVVHLWGLVGSDAERKALIALAQDVRGVSGVADEMIAAYQRRHRTVVFEMAHAHLGRGYLRTSGSDPVGENKKPQKLAESLLTALEHIEERGSLLGLVSDRAERLSLMKALADQEFVAWNAKAAKYELTGWGRQCREAPRA